MVIIISCRRQPAVNGKIPFSLLLCLDIFSMHVDELFINPMMQ